MVSYMENWDKLQHIQLSDEPGGVGLHMVTILPSRRTRYSYVAHNAVSTLRRFGKQVLRGSTCYLLGYLSITGY
jgi:hypothetical protein